MGIVKQLQSAKATVAAALVEDEPLTMKVAKALAMVAEYEYGSRITAKIAPSTCNKNRYYVDLKIDARRVSEFDGEVWGGFEEARIAFPYQWQDLVDAWTQNYEETGSWIG